jgi:prepilin signal peptidase PulO-like enzyme (type II secretory pathway)
VELILNTPFELRLLILFVVGCVAGSVCNWAIYSFAYHARPISPWSKQPAAAPPRRLMDRIPVFGWLGLARESSLFGRGFWIRPLALELFAGVLLAALYWWEVDAHGLLSERLARLYRFAAFHQFADLLVHANYLAHAILVLLMLVASFIDLDEKTIPDAVTIPGTLAGLIVLSICPLARLPEEITIAIAGEAAPWMANMQLASPRDFPASLSGTSAARGLVLGLGCYLFWCFALLPRSWRMRRGWRLAMRMFVARMAKERFTRLVAALAAAGVAGIVWAWWLGGERWQSLLSALVGLAVGAAVVWSVRIIGRYALRKEAMGFGDVTLLAMIGTFLGWQACLFVFFLAPFAGLVLGLVNWIVHGEHELAFGPYLCLGALFVIIAWAGIWEWASPFFGIPWLVPGAMILCMIVMLVLLTGVRQLRRG